MSRIAGAPRFAAAPVANSEHGVAGRGVAVDRHAVEGRVGDAPTRSRCSTGWAMAASVNMKHSIVAMSGAIMPAPLQKPLIVTSARRRSRPCASTSFGIGVGGHDGARRRLPGVRLRRPGEAVEQVRELAGIHRLADHAGARRRRPRAGRQPTALAAASTVMRTASAPLLAGEGVGVAGIDDQRARAAVLQRSRGTTAPAPSRSSTAWCTPAATVPSSSTATIRSVRPL